MALLFLRSLLFSLFFPIWTLVVGVLFSPLLFFSDYMIAWVSRFWAAGMLAGLKLICGIRMEIRGLENVPKGPAVFAPKHQSAWETLVFYRLFKYPCYVLRKELLKLPVFGSYMKQSWNIVIDREGSVSALKQLVAESRSRVARGLSIVIFPEGTRVQPGGKGTYQHGVAALYTKLEVPVVPVALNSGLYWGKNAFLKRPGTIILEFLPPIQPGLKRPEFMEDLEKHIEIATSRLVEEGRKSLARNKRLG